MMLWASRIKWKNEGRCFVECGESSFLFVNCTAGFAQGFENILRYSSTVELMFLVV